MEALNELKRLIDEKLVGTRADHVQADQLIRIIRQQLEPPNPVKNESSKS